MSAGELQGFSEGDSASTRSGSKFLHCKRNSDTLTVLCAGEYEEAAVALELQRSSEEDSNKHSALCRRVWGGSSERCGAAKILGGGQRRHRAEGADRAAHLQPAPSAPLHPAVLRGSSRLKLL